MNPEEQKTDIPIELDFVTPAMRGGRRSAGFTLIEILLATTIFLALMVVALGMFGNTSQIWQRANDEAKAFQSARLGFDLMTRNLSQATLNTHMDYVDSKDYIITSGSYNNIPVRYARQSDLHFFNANAGLNGAPGTASSGQAVFFQFPGGYTSSGLTYAGMEQLMNACGYYVEFRDEADFRPPAATFNITPQHKYRYRLMQMLQPTELNQIYTSGTSTAWIASGTCITNGTSVATPIADNVILMLIRPLDPSYSMTDTRQLCRNSYNYDSRPSDPQKASNPQPYNEHQMPPVVQVTMVAIDEPSARRLETSPIDPATKQPIFIRDLLKNGAGTLASGVYPSFSLPGNADQALAGLEKLFQNPKQKYPNIQPINYRIFSTIIPLRESKWTK